MSKHLIDTPSLRIGPGVEGDQRIVIHGADLTDHIRGFTLDARVGHIPRLILDLVVVDTTRIESPTATVWMPEGTAELLKRAGWTPPDGRPEALLDAAQVVQP